MHTPYHSLESAPVTPLPIPLPFYIDLSIRIARQVNAPVPTPSVPPSQRALVVGRTFRARDLLRLRHKVMLIVSCSLVVGDALTFASTLPQSLLHHVKRLALPLPRALSVPWVLETPQARLVVHLRADLQWAYHRVQVAA